MSWGLQGPNYALAKTMQMWRATLARARDSLLVSSNVAPAARTASMVAGNARYAAGYGGMLKTNDDDLLLSVPLPVFPSCAEYSGSAHDGGEAGAEDGR